jgi:hypothetical protein
MHNLLKLKVYFSMLQNSPRAPRLKEKTIIVTFSQKCQFIKIAPENPVLDGVERSVCWRQKKANQMLKQA